MPARPLHCLHCQGVFLPASEQAWAAVQCPHCSGQMKVSDCRTAEVRGAAAQEYKAVTEQEEAAAQTEWRHHRWAGKMVVLGCAGLVAAAGAFAMYALREPDKPHRDPGTLLLHPAAGGAWPEAEAVVEQFLTVREWRAQLPHCLEAARVQPLMEWHYARQEFTPDAGPVAVPHVQQVDAEGRTLLRVQASTPARPSVWLLLRQEDGAWKVDWEAWAGAAVVRWKTFLKEPPGTEVELPLLAALKPAADAYIIKAGGVPATHEALVLWAGDRADLAGAVLARENLLRPRLKGIGYDEAVKVIAVVKMEDPHAEPPRVTLTDILQTGWVRGR